MGIISQLKAPAAFSAAEELTARIEWEIKWAPGPVWGFWRKERSFFFPPCWGYYRDSSKSQPII